MMHNLSEIYDCTFFKEWGSENEHYVLSAEIIVNILFNEFRPGRVVDLGCGCGIYSHLLIQKGVDVLAIDGVCPTAEYAFPVPLYLHDLTVSFENIWGQFDMALCLEVAEHIPESDVDIFLDNLTRFSDLLILSAAQPNQNGYHHVNEQPKRYWVERLAKKHFFYNRSQTGRLMEIFKNNKPFYMWMVEHISVYKREENPKQFKQNLPFAVHL